MKSRVLILGGYGVFGECIAKALSSASHIDSIIAGRDPSKAQKFANTLNAKTLHIDISDDLSPLLSAQPTMVINCCGPFDDTEYRVARYCIEHRIHYIDLADNREYVSGFDTLNDLAIQKQVIAITGASTVPAISSAVLECFLTDNFNAIHQLDYGIAPGNRTPRGVATIEAILSYVGKPFKTLIEGKSQTIYGWQNLHKQCFPEIGNRWMSSCDIPDLDILPKRYPALRTIRFYAGLELPLLHIGLWKLSWLVRAGLVKNYAPYAKQFRAISLWFYNLGSDTGGMYMHMKGLGKNGQPLEKNWHVIARSGDGPQIPATPCVILAKKIIAGEIQKAGAYNAAGTITLEELCAELQPYAVKEIIE